MRGRIMSLGPVKQRDGDYVLIRACDTDENRDDAEKVLRANGCKALRFEELADGRLQAHGYLREIP